MIIQSQNKSEHLLQRMSTPYQKRSQTLTEVVSESSESLLRVMGPSSDRPFSVDASAEVGVPHASVREARRKAVSGSRLGVGGVCSRCFRDWNHSTGHPPGWLGGHWRVVEMNPHFAFNALVGAMIHPLDTRPDRIMLIMWMAGPMVFGTMTSERPNRSPPSASELYQSETPTPIPGARGGGFHGSFKNWSASVPAVPCRNGFVRPQGAAPPDVLRPGFCSEPVLRFGTR